MAHNPQGQKELGQLVAESERVAINNLTAEYGRIFMETLGQIATNRKHANVLQHLMGYLKEYLDISDKGEMAELINQYRQGFLPF